MGRGIVSTCECCGRDTRSRTGFCGQCSRTLDQHDPPGEDRRAEAHDGPTGVSVVTASKPDVALIDLDLPGFDGCEVARRLREDPANGAVRLIAVSGYGRPEDRARALAAGFDDHLVKPLDFTTLGEVLQMKREA